MSTLCIYFLLSLKRKKPLVILVAVVLWKFLCEFTVVTPVVLIFMISPQRAPKPHMLALSARRAFLGRNFSFSYLALRSYNVNAALKRFMKLHKTDGQNTVWFLTHKPARFYCLNCIILLSVFQRTNGNQPKQVHYCCFSIKLHWEVVNFLARIWQPARHEEDIGLDRLEPPSFGLKWKLQSQSINKAKVLKYLSAC